MNKLIYSFILLITMSSCESWLDVRPVGDIDGEDQISTSQGFQEILNGAYINMASQAMYGKDLSMGMVASAAQNHYQNNNEDRAIYEYNYIGDQRGRIDNLWLRAYNTIINLNFLLDNIDAKENIFEPDHFAYVKSEALALRAYIHFDMLRAFARNYQGNEEEKAIPYIDTYEKAVFPHLTATEVKEKIIEDLDAAEELVETIEPLTGQTIESIAADNDLVKRRYRINYYGILALKARVYQYTNNKNEASAFAQKVIDECPWQWGTESQLNNGENADHILSDECVFMLNVHNLITQVYQASFTENRYTTTDTRYELAKDIFEVYSGMPGANDIRYQYNFKNDKNGLKALNLKYSTKKSFSESFSVESVPMIRISEMYLILAENNADNNINAGIEFINAIREQRKVTKVENVNADELMQEVIKEFRKETYLEGQIFWMYKRLNLTQIPKLHATDKNTPMVPKNYIWPYPEAEVELGNGSRI